MNAPTLDEWKKLYDVAVQFKELAPWTWMRNDDLFAIQNPSDGEIGYCSVMGNGGMEFGLAVFLGDQGLDVYRRLMAEELDSESLEPMEFLRSISITFVDRKFLQRQDVETIRSLGLRFRGRNNWPLFRSLLPGYVPWFLLQEEALFLDLAIHFAVEVAQAIAHGSLDLAERLAQGHVYTLRTGADMLMRTWETLPPPAPARVVPTPDLSRLQRLKNRAKSPRVPVAVDWFVLPSIITGETERPYYPVVFMAVQQNGLMMGMEILEPWATDSERQEALVGVLEKAAILPQEIVVPNEEGRRLVRGVADELGCRITIRSMPGMEFMKRSLLESMGR